MSTQEFREALALRRAISYYVSDFTGVFTIGIQLLMCTYGLSAFLATPLERRKGRLPYMILSFVIFILFVTITGFDLPKNCQILYRSEPGASYYNERSRAIRGAMATASQALINAFVALGDALLLYRCYAIWNDTLWVLVLPTLVFLSYIALALTNVARSAMGISGSSESQILISQQVQIAYTCLTVALNIITTSLIAYRIRSAQRLLSRSLPGRRMVVYSNAARIVIESALPLSLFGLFYAIFNTCNWASRTSSGLPNLDYYLTSSISSSVYFCFAALSPQMIIFRVTTGRSHTHQGDLGSSVNPDSEPLGALDFKSGHADQSSISSYEEEEDSVLPPHARDDPNAITEEPKFVARQAEV
ncbi:hypothetical protein CC2G_004373 [Coprinopsis cinerea AmutBmut pab1-1]|nr:hypothetical protein CC2G_004373 [Coprinopsis cinerea AmutBmut pab1-1]